MSEGGDSIIWRQQFSINASTNSLQFNQKASGQCNLKIHAEEKRPRNNGDRTEEKERMGRKESLFLTDRKRWKRVERTRKKKA